MAYGVLCVIGTAMPLIPFVPWVADHGIDPPLFLAELFANRISAFFAWDVIISGMVTILFVIIQGRRDAVGRLLLPILATLMIGVSCGLPLFLGMREQKIDTLRRN